MKINMLCKSILIGIFLIAGINKAEASSVCNPNYGGGETCTETNVERISLDKEVSFKKNDNFSGRVKGAEEGDTVYFRITIKNEGDTDFEKLTIEDDLPKYLKTSEDTEWTIKDFKAGDEWSEVFKAEVVDGEDLPDNDICVVNEARVKENGKTVDEDTAIVCIETSTKVLGVKELPVTGAQSNGFGREIALGIISLGMLILGLGLKKVV